MSFLPWQKPDRTIPMLFLTESRRIVDDIRLPVFKAYVVDEKRQEGWLTWADAFIPNAKTNQYHLLVSERSMAPLLLKGSKKSSDDMKKLIEQTAAEAAEEAHFNNEDQNKKSFREKIIGISILALVLLIIIMVIAGLLQAGTLQLPG